MMDVKTSMDCANLFFSLNFSLSKNMNAIDDASEAQINEIIKK